MAQLVHMRIISIEDLEESLGVSRFRDFIWHSEERFQKQLAKVVRRVTEDLAIQAVFVSGPTSSGKRPSAAAWPRRFVQVDDWPGLSLWMIITKWTAFATMPGAAGF